MQIKATALVCRYIIGNDAEGKPMLRTRTYSRINPSLTDEVLNLYAQKLLVVQSYDAELERRNHVPL